MEQIMILKAELSKKILMKIERKQKTITTNENLHEYGYIRGGRSREKQVWKLGAGMNLMYQWKQRIRNIDIQFFNRQLGSRYMKKWEIDHDWNNGATVKLKTPEEHRNDLNGKGNQHSLVETEKWLDELYPGKRQ